MEDNKDNVTLQTSAPGTGPAGPVAQPQPTIPITPAQPAATDPTAPATNPTTPRTAVKVYRQRVHDKNSTGKHAPIAPCGTTILERDNPGLSRTPFRKGKAEPEKLKLTLIDTKGNIHKRFFADKDTMDWDDPVMVGNANKWRNQVMRRVFKRDHTFKSRTIRAKWGVRETGTLKSEVENKVKAVGGRRLTGAEWKVLADEHNARFAGTKVLKGERLLGGQVAKVEEVIDKRTIVAIKALFGRNADLKQFLSDLVGENVVESGDEAGIGGGVDAKGVDEGADDEDETEEDEASPTKKRKVDHGGVIDPRLEDPSDDEDDGQRPASNPVGGALVSAF